jgi:hypothetical protein
MATATIASSFLKDLIAAGHLSPEMAYLACDPGKDKHQTEKIVGISYDGRRDKHTRAMVPGATGKLKMRMITEEHESVTEEPSGKYLAHFVPEKPVHPEKPAR